MDFTGKKVLVFGLGVSGMGALRLLDSKASELYAINQGDPKTWDEFDEVSKICGAKNCISQDDAGASKVTESADYIILSPGIPREHKLLSNVTAPIWSEIELAFQFCNKPIIAVTGTNGKTTTVSFLDHLFKSLGKKVFTGGNIGVAFCDYVRKQEEVDYILLELSSFQLESTFSFKPQVSVVLNVFPNHGERYSKNEDYAKAKFNITNKMDSNGTLIFDSGNNDIQKWAEGFVGKKIAIDTSKTEAIEAHVRGMFNLDNFKLPGIHNKINLDFCLEVLNALNLLEGNGDKVQMGIDSFAGVSHRIEYVPCEEGFSAYNDAKSTNWDATITAINSMSEFDKDLVLILGGKLRGHNDQPPKKAEELFKKKVKKVLLIGESAELLEKTLSDWLPCFNKGTIEEAVRELKEESFHGIVLLSPGFPSFDQYPNYIKRGEAFKNLFD